MLTRVRRRAVLAGGDLELEGTIDGNLKAAGGRIRLAGRVVGDVDLAGGRIELMPEAFIGGKLTYRSRSQARIAPEATILGGVEFIETPIFERPSLAWLIGLLIAAWLLAILALGLLGLVLHGLAPNLLIGAEERLRRRSWASLGLGFAGLVAIPVAANLLLASIIGIAVGIYLYAVYWALVLCATVLAAYWLGLRLARPLGWARDGESTGRRSLWTLLGLTLLGLLVFVPLLGIVMVALALSLSLGALVLEIWQRHAVQEADGPAGPVEAGP